MKQITCIDKDGYKNNFLYSLEIEKINDYNQWKFSVIPDDGLCSDFFFFSGETISDEKIKITMMNNHNQEIYSGKGIPERLIEELHIITGKDIVSSSNNPHKKVLEEEYRTPPATKVWQRLVNINRASYNTEDDLFTFIP